MSFTDHIIKKVRGKEKRIIFVEPFDERIKKAVEIISAKKIARPILVFKNKSEKYKIKGAESYSPDEFKSLNDWIMEYYSLRKKKYPTLDLEEVRKEIIQPHYFGALLLKHGFGDGMISGATKESKPFLPAFRVIGVKDGCKIGSSFFIMEKDDKVFLFADCAVNINPDEEELAEIAIQTSATARLLGIEPRTALLSYSTLGSGKGESVEKVRKAVKIAREKTMMKIEGEFQLDAAIVKDVAEKKVKNNSEVAGKANVLIFPNLDSGNIGYKLLERLGGYRAIGPILQGLNAWISDLSRGCDVESIVRTTAVISFLSGIKEE